MCGILGIFSFNQQTIEAETLKKSLNVLSHRGPDNQNIWMSRDKTAALGHVRLSIIDLTTGDQPLANFSQNIHLVANGEFYDFEQRRSELEKQDHKFLTKTDSEIAIHLYERYGTKCVDHLRGEFAFIIWDEKTKTCFAARDRFGIKPLFYSVYNNKLYIASEVKALLAAGIPARWDNEAMKLFMNSTLNFDNRCLFDNINQVPPGHFLIAKNGKVQLVKYWDLDYPEKNDTTPLLSEKEYVDQLKVQLEDAVRVRLRADVPVACYLSGGLDSSIVLGLAAKHVSALPAFTLSFDNKDYDEYNIAKEMAEKAGAEFNPITINQADLADNFSEAIWHGETFFYNGHGIAKFLLSQAVRDAGYKVVLTGEGADELFGGYVHFRIDQLFHGQNALDKASKEKLLAELKRTNNISLGMLLPTEKSKTLDNVEKRLRFTPSWFLVAAQGSLLMSELMSDDFRDKAFSYDGFDAVLKTFDIDHQLKNREPFNQSLYIWSKMRLANYILSVLGDRMEMAHSIEGRVPFLDHHVAEFMRKVPVDLKVHGMSEKYLLREAGKSVITETVYNRQKHPFLAPPASLHGDDALNELLQETLRSKTIEGIPFFNRKKIIAVLDRLPGMSQGECISWDPVLMMALSACVMHERFGLSA